MSGLTLLQELKQQQIDYSLFNTIIISVLFEVMFTGYAAFYQ